MDIYVTDESGEKRRVKSVYKCINGKPVKLEEDTPEYLEAVRYAAQQGVICYGT